jgi:hypothetical protein
VPRRAPGLAPALALREVFRERTDQRDMAAWFRSDFRGLGYKPPETLPDFSRYYTDVKARYHFALAGDCQAEWGVAYE